MAYNINKLNEKLTFLNCLDKIHLGLLMVESNNNKNIDREELVRELEQARDKIRELEKDSFYLTALLSHTTDHIYFKDKKSRFLKVSKSMARYFEEEDENNCVGKSDADYFSREHAKAAREDEEEIIKTGVNRINIEEKETWRAKSEAWVSSTKLPLKSEAGDIIGTFGISRIITEKKNLEVELQRANSELEERVRQRTAELEGVNVRLFREAAIRKAAEEELQKEKDLLDITFSSIGEAIITTDAEGNIQLMNAAAERICGWNGEKIKGLHITKALHLKDRFNESELENPALKVFRTKKKTNLDCILTDKKRREHIVSYSASPIHDQQGKIVGAAVIFRDITQQIKLEEEYNRNRNIQSLGNLASGIAHDFNNYLAGIIGNLNLIKLNEGLDVELQTLVESAERATKGARKLALQLLSFAKGGETLQLNTDIPSLISRRMEELFPAKSFDTEINAKGQIWQVRIDTAQLEKVIGSILQNCKDALPKGGSISVEINNASVRKKDAASPGPGKYVSIGISDNGPGIKPEDLEKIFLPYFTTRKTKSGLGLTTSYSIIQKHGGTIKVDSKKDRGTTVKILIPALLQSNDKDSENKDGDRKKILYMDDNELLLQVAKKMIHSLGYKAICAADGKEALKQFEKACKTKDKFYAVIMDLTVPGGMGAREIIKDLREMDPGIYTIISSGYTEDKAITEYKSFGFDAVITKPFTINDLRSALSKRE